MPFDTWKMSLRYAFRRLGVKESDEIHWQIKYVTYFHGAVIHQFDGYNCGPIACMVLWGLINPNSRDFQDTWGDFQTSVPLFRNKVIEYINTQMQNAHSLFSVRQVQTVTCLDGTKKGKQKRKVDNIAIDLNHDNDANDNGDKTDMAGVVKKARDQKKKKKKLIIEERRRNR